MPRRSKKLDPLMEGYLEYMLTVERRASGTVKDIRCTLRRVSEAMAKRHPSTSLWELKLTDFIRWLEDQTREGYSTLGLCKNVCHIRGFLNYAKRSGRCDRNVMAHYHPEDRYQARTPEFLTIEEALSLIQACPSGTPTERRDRVMLMLLYGCGLRTGELCALKVKDLSVERRELHVKHAKGDIERIIPIPDVVFTELLAYLQERKARSRAMFVTEAKRRPIRQTLVGEVVRLAAARTDIDRPVTPKVLRHSFATHLIDRGVDLAIIARLMGHRSPKETGVYLHALPGRQRDAVKRLDEEGAA